MLGLAQARDQRSLFLGSSQPQQPTVVTGDNGIGLLWSKAVEGIARQPEATKDISKAGLLGSLLIVRPEVADTIVSGSEEEQQDLASQINSFMDELYPDPEPIVT